MDIEVPFLAGYLNIPTQSGFSRISKKKPCHRYCLLFNSSRHGIERLEICESKEDKNPKIITLENCVKITQENSPVNVIQIVKKTGTLILNPISSDDHKQWVSALQTVAFYSTNSGHGNQSAIEEDNDLYCSSFGDGLFIITLIPSETSIRCNFEPTTYVLHLTTTELQLKTTDDLNIVVANWPYRFIRKYGYRDGKFTFEAGRKCSTGEGVFILDHKNPQEVFRCMSAKMKSMKKLISSDNVSSIECGENQLGLAALMEAGSRSPIPPSPSNPRSLDIENNSTQSSISLRGFISSNDSLNNFSINVNTNNCAISNIPVKQMPSKPPRKLPIVLDKKIYDPISIISMEKQITEKSATTITPSPEIVGKNYNVPELPIRNENIKTERNYESIEPITDAWRTLGISDVKHTERIVSVINDVNINDCHTPLAIKPTKIIDIDIGEGRSIINPTFIDSTYDRLDFLSPNNKNSSGYKTIVTVTTPTNRVRFNQSSSNDYEFIDSANIKICRKADDSHLGYGVLRKSVKEGVKTQIIPAYSSINKTVSSITNPPKVETEGNDLPMNTCSYNEINYSIVSKPKRV